jgi:chromosomal replication initiator protein
MDINNPSGVSENEYQELSEQPFAEQAAQKAWQECLNIIRERTNNQSFKTWFEPIVPLRLERDRFAIQIPSQFFYEWLEEHYFSLLNEALTQVIGTEVAIEYVISEADTEEAEENPNLAALMANSTELRFMSQPPGDTTASLPDSPARTPLGTVKQSPIDSFLNPRYTFENYIKGESNQFARAAALAVANNPGGTSFNPLVIYGGVGLGKTHLVHAIGNHVLRARPYPRVLYVSSEKFTVDFVDAIQKDSVSKFSSFYRSVDVLIVDDIQFFTGKEKTQDYFFHTFNALHQQGKQIVLSCDRPPKDLQGLNERLISRFQWGLTADIQPPDLEMRIAILQKKIADAGAELSHEVVDFIAVNVTSNIRELEGCLIGLLARASLENRTIGLDLAKEVVSSVIGEMKTHITIEEIQRVVCEHLGIPEDLIRAKTRKQEIVNARQIAMYLSKEYTNSSLKTIGLHFGGRDHSTVIHAYQTVEDCMKVDAKQRQLVSQLKSKLEARTP